MELVPIELINNTKLNVVMIETPADSPSKPSIQLKEFVIATIQNAVIKKLMISGIKII